MVKEHLENMIQKRKSVRSISKTRLRNETLSNILLFTQNTTKIFPGIRSVARMLERSEIKPFGSVFAPHYLAIYSERTPDAELNAGFILEQTDLYLSSKGIGSCWLGMTQPNQNEYDGLPFVVMLAVGMPEEVLHRTSLEQFKRKSLAEIAMPGVLPAFIDYVRLAPSAMNKQPWFFTGEDSFCHAFSVRGKGLINIAEGWRFVDLGIAIAHLYIAATASGKTVIFKREDSIPFRNGSEYVISCHLE